MNLVYRQHILADGTAIYSRAPTLDADLVFFVDARVKPVRHFDGYMIISLASERLPDPIPQYISVVQGDDFLFTGTALTETEAKALALAPQKELVHQALVLEDNLVHCTRGLYDAFDTFITREENEWADSNGQGAALTRFAPIRTALVEPHQCLLRSERTISLSGMFLEQFGGVETTEDDVKFVATHRAKPLAEFAVKEGVVRAEADAITKPENQKLFQDGQGDAAKLAAVKKNPAALKALETDYFTKEGEVEKEWLGDDDTNEAGLITHPNFLAVSKLWDKDKDWDETFLRALPDMLNPPK